MSGDEYRGVRYELTKAGLRLSTTTGEEVEISLDDLARVQRGQAVPTEVDPTAWHCRLVDGSDLYFRTATLIDGKLTGVMLDEVEVEIATRNIRWVRTKPLGQDAGLKQQWSEVLAEEPTADVLVVRREVEGAISLNAVDGVIGNLVDGAVKFKFDDSEIDVDMERVDSLLFYHPAGRRLTDVSLKVRDTHGQELQVRDWIADADEFTFKTVAGTEVSLSKAEVDLLDFEAGKIIHLSDLEPSTFEWTPFVEGVGDQRHLQQLFSLGKDESFSGGQLQLFSASGFSGRFSALRSFPRGLALRSQTRLIYRVSGDATRFVGWMGLDPETRSRGHVTVRLQGDGRVLEEFELDGTAAEPVRLDLDVAGVRRFSIEIGFGENGDLGDRVHLCDPKFVK